MRRRLVQVSIVAMLALTLSGCGRLRDWLSPFRGLNSDRPNSIFSDPEAGQYRQPRDNEYLPE